MISKCCWKRKRKLWIRSFFKQLSPICSDKIMSYVTLEYHLQASQSSRYLISATYDFQKLCWYLRQNPLYTPFEFLIWKRQVELWKCEHQILYLPPVSVSPLCVTRSNRSVQNIQSVNHRPNQPLDEAKNEKGRKMIHRTELELIKYTVSSLLCEIASVLRCVKNKTFSDIFF